MINKDFFNEKFLDLQEEEQAALLLQELEVTHYPQTPACQLWFSQVFTYCTASQLNEAMFRFNIAINSIRNFLCYEHKETVFLGCTCPCGRKQLIMYFTLTPTERLTELLTVTEEPVGT